MSARYEDIDDFEFDKNREFKLTAKQDDALSLISKGAMFILLYGGSRSTKTFTIVRTIINRALASPDSRHAILRFRFNHVKASIVHDTFPKVMELCFPNIKYHVDKTDWFVAFENGAEIWFGGLDDKERTEKILGREFVTIFLNECSQISYQSYLILLTRLAQKCYYRLNGQTHEMSLRLFCDENPPSKGHWTYRLFLEHKDPNSKTLLKDPQNYAQMLMNPMDNAENLPPSYLKILDNMPKRQRDRFFLGKFGDASENALWNTEVFERNRVNGDDLPRMSRIIVSVDPSGADDEDNADNDAIGIIVMGLGIDGAAYLFEDLTIKAGPAKWAGVVASAYERHEADRVIGEKNFGGAMVEFVIRSAKADISYKSVIASRGKTLRAEPVSAIHERDKIKFVGNFPELEDELIGFTTTGYIGENSPNRADAFVFAVLELFPGMVRPPKRNEIIEVPPTLKRF